MGADSWQSRYRDLLRYLQQHDAGRLMDELGELVGWQVRQRGHAGRTLIENSRTDLAV